MVRVAGRRRGALGHRIFEGRHATAISVDKQLDRAGYSPAPHHLDPGGQSPDGWFVRKGFVDVVRGVHAGSKQYAISGRSRPEVEIVVSRSRRLPGKIKKCTASHVEVDREELVAIHPVVLVVGIGSVVHVALPVGARPVSGRHEKWNTIRSGRQRRKTSESGIVIPPIARPGLGIRGIETLRHGQEVDAIADGMLNGQTEINRVSGAVKAVICRRRIVGGSFEDLGPV